MKEFKITDLASLDGQIFPTNGLVTPMVADDTITAASATITVQGVAPTPAEAREPFTVTVTFSETVTGFEQSELTVQNGTVTAFSGTGATYSFSVTPGEAGAITLQVAAGVAADGAGNVNLASEQVTLNYINEQETQEETQQVITKLMTHRNRITMDKRPTIGRRLQRLTGGLQNDGSISAFGMTYKDGRLPVAMNIKEDEVSFSYSMLKSRMHGPAPSLSGRLAVGPFGTVESAKTDAANANKLGRLSDSPGSYLRRKNDEESAAIHAVLFGEDERHAKAEEKKETLELQASQPERLALNREEFEARYAATPAGQDDRRLDVWVEGTFGGFDIDGSTGSYGVMHVGADYLYTPNVLLGLSAQIDMVESEHSDDDTSSEGTGFMFGPYASIRLTDELLFDGRVAWDKSSNELTSANAMTDEFDSERWMVSGALIGRVDVMDNITMLPEARLSWYREDSGAYTNGQNVDIQSSAVETGSLEFGPTINGTFEHGDDGRFQPFASLKGIWTFANNQYSDNEFENQPQADTGVRARLEMGFDFTPSIAAGRTVSVSGSLDGLGDDDYEVWGVNIRLKQKF